MKKAAMVVSTFYQKNRLFDRSDPISNKDDCLYSFYALRQAFLSHEVDLSTQDVNPLPESDIVIFNDMPRTLPEKRPGQRFYLLALESIAVHPANFDQRRYALFDKVFTWKDDIIDKSKVVKINYAFLFPLQQNSSAGARTRMVCLMANNKTSFHPGELYSKRVEILDWFEQHHPADIDLYGGGWDGFIPRSFLGKIVQRSRLGTIVPKHRHYSFYRGIASPKLPMLRNYRFNVCYENVRDVPGYITEKIFDCFFTGCVPIYWGAGNITDHIPGNCFIDKRKFGTYEALYQYLKDMDPAAYTRYLTNIDAFLRSPRSAPFTADHFARTIVHEVMSTT